MNKKLRDYQTKNALECYDILKDKKIVYIQHSVRTGKTATALETIRLSKFKNVLFLTKKKAIQSILDDYNDFLFDAFFDLTVANYESLHKVKGNFDCLVLDENHVNSAFPKPSKRTKEIKLRFSYLPMIMLSGTPASESGSQWFHQFWMSWYSPFKEYTNFYKWANHYVNIDVRNMGYATVKDYSKCKDDLINKSLEPYIHKFTQQEAGFESKVNLNVINCEPMNEQLIKRLKNDLVVEGKDEVILADSSVKLMQKIHQLENGTIKFESGNTKILDYSKANFIKNHFKGKKIAILYYYIAELELLKQVFDNHTTDLNEFNNSDKVYIGQQYSNALGVNLSKAEYLVFYNFSFSGTNFVQSIDRLTTATRLKNDVFFIFPKGSLTEKIFKVVQQKKNFTEKMFKKC